MDMIYQQNNVIFEYDLYTFASSNEI